MSEAPKAACAECPHCTDMLENGRCRPGDTCVRAMSGRQIERFFRTNPALAEDYAGDAFWERRAIAARCLSQKRLLNLLDDTAPEVRLEVVERIALDEAQHMLGDSDWRVRLRLAERLPLEAVGSLTRDPDEDVRNMAINRRRRSSEKQDP